MGRSLSRVWRRSPRCTERPSTWFPFFRTTKTIDKFRIDVHMGIVTQPEAFNARLKQFTTG